MSTEDSEIKFGPLIDFSPRDSGLPEGDLTPSPVVHSTPIHYHVIDEAPPSPDVSQLSESIRELKSLVLGVGLQNKSAEQRFEELAERFDNMESRLSLIESGSNPSKLMNESGDKYLNDVQNQPSQPRKVENKGHVVGGLEEKLPAFSQDPPSLPATNMEPSPARPTSAQVAHGENVEKQENRPEIKQTTCPTTPKLEPSTTPPPRPQGAHHGIIEDQVRSQEKPKVRPATFNGSTAWEDYLAQFELVADINKWSDSMKATYLAVSLTGSAQAVLGDLERSSRTNYAELTSALAARFGTENQQEVFRASLKSRYRQRGETLPELAQAVRRLTRQAYPEAPQQLRETLARDHFLDALNDLEMQWRVHQSRPRTLNDALTFAVESEAFQSANRQHMHRQARSLVATEPEVKSDGAVRAASAADTDLQEIKGMLKKILEEKSSRPYGRYTGCHSCGDMSHFQRDCPHGRAGDNRPSGNGNQSSSRG